MVFSISFSGSFEMMKTKMVTFVLLCCALLAIYVTMSVEAGKVIKITDALERIWKAQFKECCKQIRCYKPDLCLPVKRGFIKCKCVRH